MDAETALEAVREFLDNEEIAYTYNDERKAFISEFALENSLFKGFTLKVVLCDDEEESVEACLIVGITSLGVKAQYKQGIEHLLFNINNRMNWGMWQINERNEEIIYIRPIRLDGDDAVLTEEVLGYGVYSTVSVMEHYLDAILAVDTGASTADAELRRLYTEEENDITEAGAEVALGNNSESIDPFIIFLPKEENSGEGGI